jgi:F420-non-reducing hydrogenase small subunit
MTRLKIAMYWLSGCGGCEESILDTGEDLIAILESVDIVFWPVATDIKYQDLDCMPDNSIDFSFINGAVRTEDHIRMAKLFRRKSKKVIAHGSCAHLGGVPGLSNFYERESILNRSYLEVPSFENPKEDQDDIPVCGELTDRVAALSHIIDVDYFLPGCPTPPEIIKNTLLSFLAGEFPEKGSVFGEKTSLCSSCHLINSKPDRIYLTGFKRIHLVDIDPDRCFLDQGLICLGPATRGGCNAQCIKVNIPCRGCFGPLDNISDHGARIISMVSTLIGTSDVEEIKRIVDEIPDPAGLFYRYSLASSIIKNPKKQR